MRVLACFVVFVVVVVWVMGINVEFSSYNCFKTYPNNFQDINATDNMGWTPVHCAAFHGRLGCLQVTAMYSFS